MKNYILLIVFLASLHVAFAQSPLADGDLYELTVTEEGVYYLDVEAVSKLGINTGSIDPRNIHIYGNGGGRLPESIMATYSDKPEQLPILVTGQDDGRFDGGDRIYFYAEGPHRRNTNSSGIGVYERNYYTDTDHYFLKISNQPGLRVAEQSSIGGETYVSTAFDDYARLEEDLYNPMHDWEQTQGSGKIWYGEYFSGQREKTYPGLFYFPNRLTDEPIKVVARMLVRSKFSSRFNIKINESRTLTSNNAGSVSSYADPVSTFGYHADINNEVTVSGDQLDLTISYPRPHSVNDGSQAWLDYVEVRVRRQLRWAGNTLIFRDHKTQDQTTVRYELEAAPDDLIVWDISNPLQPVRQQGNLSNGIFSFGTQGGDVKTFVAFTPGQAAKPTLVEKVPNQDIRSLSSADMLVIYPEEFVDEVQRYVMHRASFSHLSIGVATVEQVMNEFASGAFDPTAIRNFVHYIKDENPDFRYLLLFGDGSFDYRDVYGEGKNFVPVYERDSSNPIFAFPTDDYYVITQDDTGTNSLDGMITVHVGRLPVKSVQEARQAVDKIISYDTNADSYGEWRNRMLFVGDDEDNDVHTRDANEISVSLQRRRPEINAEKVYLDAFPQITTPGGDRFPAATEALNQAIFKGVLAAVYLGHGGSKGWAQERVLNIEDINQWTNIDQLPLFITATCTFAGYDDPTFTTAGEAVFLNPRGGAIALMTTVRPVYASLNASLTRRVVKELYIRDEEGMVRSIGEVMSTSKNALTSSSSQLNARKFTLLGDPSQQLAIPDYDVVTTEINQQPIDSIRYDTLRALQKVTIKGKILDSDGLLYSDFNGELIPTIFDKETVVNTLAQDARSNGFSFKVQKNIIFKGRASVVNGEFSFTFVVPRDINYDYGEGKISYYARDLDKLIDASGSYERIVIGGTYANALADDQGPQVEVFMNDEGFVFGGITGPDPILLVHLKDDNGINVVGNSIGHDLEAVLDGDTQNAILLNDFYQSEKDDYREGKVRFPLENLSDGRHSIRVKAWDIANNSAEGYTEFVVASNENVLLQNILNYPNPFIESTCFQFDHNLEGQDLDVTIQIYSVSGRLVKTINEVVVGGATIRQHNCLRWDGRGDYGGDLARGVYLYKVMVRTTGPDNNTISAQSALEKLVLLR